MHPGKINDLRFLDGQKKEIELFQGFDFHVFDQVAQGGVREPLLVLGFAPSGSVASHVRVPGASGPWSSTRVTRHVVFSRRSHQHLPYHPSATNLLPGVYVIISKFHTRWWLP